MEAWVDAELARRGLVRTGELEERRFSPWSRVLRVPTSGGTLWAKAVAPGLRHEIVVTEEVARLAPELVVAPLAADRTRGFMLFADGGPTLREAPSPGRWAQTLARYAELQLASASHADALLALGAFDRRPGSLLAQYERLAAGFEHRDRLLELAPQLAEACARLAGGLPAAIEHDDLHDGNVLADGRIFDWGDAGVAHPFFTTVISLQEEPDGVRDAYLEPFTALASRAELLAILEDALWVGKAARALTWAEILAGLDDDARREHGRAVETWLLLFLAERS